MELNTLATRGTTILGPYSSDMMLSIKKIGSSETGVVHQLCAPVIYDYSRRQNKLLEVDTVPNAFLIKKNKMYALSAFVSCVEDGLSKFKI